MYSWREAAVYCYDNFGVQVNWEEKFFICPECGEPVYECDWINEIDFKSGGWLYCPICQVNFEEIY